MPKTLIEPTVSLSRSQIFVPGSRPDMIEKAAGSAADSICIDLEDSVTIDQKEISRANLIQSLKELRFDTRTLIVRINALDTPFAYRDVNLSEIRQSSARLEGLIFGPGDYAASMRMPLTSIGVSDEHDLAYPGHRWHAAMHAIVAAARANGLRCTDGPFANFKDEAGLETSCRTALAMGFDGKQCIHPAQLEKVNTVFSPTTQEIH